MKNAAVIEVTSVYKGSTFRRVGSRWGAAAEGITLVFA
jgi:hypothetical protein